MDKTGRNHGHAPIIARPEFVDGRGSGCDRIEK
jgi:hypothetical protein